MYINFDSLLFCRFVIFSAYQREIKRRNGGSCIHLFLGEDALDVNPAMRLDGAVAAFHGAYP